MGIEYVTVSHDILKRLDSLGLDINATIDDVLTTVNDQLEDDASDVQDVMSYVTESGTITIELYLWTDAFDDKLTLFIT